MPLPNKTTFQDVVAGQLPSASNTNASLAAIRELQRGFPASVSVEVRLGVAIGDDSPEVDDNPLASAVLNEGYANVIEPALETVYRSEVDSVRQSEFLNVGQMFFSGSETVAMISHGSIFIPIRLGGSTKIIAKTTTEISAAEYDGDDIVVGTGLADVYDFNDNGTRLVLLERNVRIVNIVEESVDEGKIIQAASFGNRYVLDFEVCS